MKAKLLRIVKKLRKALLFRYGENLSQIILFGSQARGDATSDSDIDVLVVLEDSVAEPFQEYRKWSDWITDELLESGELVNLVFTSRQRYDSVKSPLYLNIQAEGILIYDRRVPVAFGASQ